MTTKAIDDSPVWKQFETEAKKRRRNPVKLVSDYIRAYSKSKRKEF